MARHCEAARGDGAGLVRRHDSYSSLLPIRPELCYRRMVLKDTVTVVGDITGPAVPKEHRDSLGK